MHCALVVHSQNFSLFLIKKYCSHLFPLACMSYTSERSACDTQNLHTQCMQVKEMDSACTIAGEAVISYQNVLGKTSPTNYSLYMAYTHTLTYKHTQSSKIFINLEPAKISIFHMQFLLEKHLSSSRFYFYCQHEKLYWNIFVIFICTENNLLVRNKGIGVVFSLLKWL